MLVQVNADENARQHIRDLVHGFRKNIRTLRDPRTLEAAAERRDAKRIIERVRQIIHAKKKLQTTPGQHERDRLERQVEAHEAVIDELVYKLYGLKGDDIRIVEEGTQG